MRRLITFAFIVIGAGCASMGAPPGGPARHTPPEIVTVTPDSGDVAVRAKSIMFTFDEVISDKSGPKQNLTGLFLISPRDGEPRVSWHRQRLEVRPHRGDWRPNTAYTVTLLPGLADLSGNLIKTPTTIVFTTGKELPAFGVQGRVFDWSAERVAPGALVEAISRPDSIVYVAVADSLGQFYVGPLNAGDYAVRAFVDANHNQTLDPGEIWDSTDVHIVDAQPYLEMLAAKRDTIGPSILSVTIDDSLQIRVTFNKPLNAASPIDKQHFHVLHADSMPMVVLSAKTLGDFTRDAAKAKADSLRALDSLAAIKDTTKRFPRPVPPPPATLDKAPPPPPKPSKPAPSTIVIVRLDVGTHLEPKKGYRVVADSMSNLMGFVTRTAGRTFSTPAPPKIDSTKVRPPAAKPDTVKPPVKPPAPPSP